ncbi:MAG: MFS transporter [Oscillospiraceae bacterium]|nr:MFS transporter [Oscillospiraceae bacterium]
MTELQDPHVIQDEPEKARWATKNNINYGIGVAGRSVANGFTGRLQYFTTTIMGMHHGHVAPLMIFGQAFDGLSDLIMGAIIDNTRSRWGKFRPWWGLGTVLNALATVLLFGVPSAMAANPAAATTVAYVAIMWLMWDLTYTLVDVSYWTMIPALAPHGEQRDIVSTIPRVFSGVFGIATAFNMSLVSVLGGGEFNNAHGDHMFLGFRYFAIVASVVYLITSLYGAFTVREPNPAVRVQGEVRQRVNPIKAFVEAAKILVGNKQTLAIVVVMILFNLGQNMTNSAAIFFFRHVSQYSDAEFGIFNLAMGLASGIGMFLFPMATKRIGRTRFYRLAFLLPVLGCAGMFLFSQFMPGVFVPFLISLILGHIGYGVMGVMQNVTLADTVDYGEWKTGQRNEGILFSTLTTLSKLAGLLSNAVGITTQWTLRFGGAFGVPAQVSAFQANGFKLWMFGFSPIALLISFLVFTFCFKLTPKRMAEITADLAERKRQVVVDTDTGAQVVTRDASVIENIRTEQLRSAENRSNDNQ